MIKNSGTLLLISDVPHLAVCSVGLNCVVNQLEMGRTIGTISFTDAYTHERET